MRAAVTNHYDYRMTPYLTELLHGRGADDPLVRQFMPDARELQALHYENADPIGDHAFSPVAGVVHRYPDRVLLKVAHACPVYCRFCFRREMIGRRGHPLQGPMLKAALDYIRANPKVEEVILTGGDPFTLSSRRIGSILGELASMTHIGVLRIHTRVPVVAPSSITEATIEALEVPVPLYIAIHVNHHEEITTEAIAALRRLSEGGATLLSQTVLLKGVNDDAQVLARLFRTLVRHRVQPYYLHHPDLAPGTSHFRVPIETGQELMRQLRGTVSGICLPTYVLDIPGGFGKVPIGPAYLSAPESSGGRQVVDVRGAAHHYPE
jgi:lysine 2,3-aminomutase